MARDIPGSLDDIAKVVEQTDAMVGDLLLLPVPLQVHVLTKWRSALRAARRRSRVRTAPDLITGWKEPPA